MTPQKLRETGTSREGAWEVFLTGAMSRAERTKVLTERLLSRLRAAGLAFPTNVPTQTTFKADAEGLRFRWLSIGAPPPGFEWNPIVVSWRMVIDGVRVGEGAGIVLHRAVGQLDKARNLVAWQLDEPGACLEVGTRRDAASGNAHTVKKFLVSLSE